MLKMYFLVRESVDTGHAMLAVAHGAVACYKQFAFEPIMQEWSVGSFRKVVCKVDDSTFEAFKKEKDHVLMTESGLDGEETCLVFCPREEWSKKFKFLRLYR